MRVQGMWGGLRNEETMIGRRGREEGGSILGKGGGERRSD